MWDVLNSHTNIFGFKKSGQTSQGPSKGLEEEPMLVAKTIQGSPTYEWTLMARALVDAP